MLDMCEHKKGNFICVGMVGHTLDQPHQMVHVNKFEYYARENGYIVARLPEDNYSDVVTYRHDDESPILTLMALGSFAAFLAMLTILISHGVLS